MNLTKRHRMMLGVLGLAVGAFLIDAMLPGPAAASASVTPEPGTSPAPITPGTAGVQTAGINNAGHEALMRVVERLRAIEPPEAVTAGHPPDPFVMAPVAQRQPQNEAPAQISIISHSPVIEEPIDTNAPAAPPIRISSIMNAPEGRLALIDGQLRREGDRMGEWTITRIAERSIRISNGTHEIRVPMDR